MVEETQEGKKLSGNHSHTRMTINLWLVLMAVVYLTHQDYFIKPFGRPGGGAPRRTTSGKLQTSIVSDPATKFQPSFKKDVDRVLV